MGIEDMFKKTKEFFSGSISREEALKKIEAHPVKKQAYNKLAAEDPAKADKYIEFIQSHPVAKYVKWNEEKQIFQDAGLYGLSGLEAKKSEGGGDK